MSRNLHSLSRRKSIRITVGATIGQGLIFCTCMVAVQLQSGFFMNPVQCTVPDGCKIRAPEISVLQTRNMHGPIIRIIFIRIDCYWLVGNNCNHSALQNNGSAARLWGRCRRTPASRMRPTGSVHTPCRMRAPRSAPSTRALLRPRLILTLYSNV